MFTRQIKCHFNKHLEEKKIFPDFPEEMDEFPDFPWLFASGKNIFKFPDFPEIPWPVRTLYTWHTSMWRKGKKEHLNTIPANLSQQKLGISQGKIRNTVYFV